MRNKNYITQGFVWLFSGISAFAMPTNTTEVEVPANAQQPIAAGFVVHNSNAFYAAPGSIASSTKVVVLDNPTANLEIGQLPTATPVNKAVCVQTPTKQRKHTHKTTPATAAVEKPVAQKTTVTCPFGNYPTHSNHFYALHNGVAITTSVKTSPLTPLQRRGELSLCVEFILLEAEKPIFFYTNTQILQSKYIGQITTRPPPSFTT